MKPKTNIPPLPTELSHMLWFFIFWPRNIRHLITSTTSCDRFFIYSYDKVCNFNYNFVFNTTSYDAGHNNMQTHTKSVTAHTYSTVSGGVGVKYCHSDSYRFGFNAQEKVNEIAGLGNHNTAEFWEYSTRTGRRWNLDPVVKPHESPFATFANNPILFVDPFGADTTFYRDDETYDEQAKSDFMREFNTVKSKVNSLEESIKNTSNAINEGNLSSRELKKTNKKLESDEKSLADWKKLDVDFENIINSPILFQYSSDISNLLSDEFGNTQSVGSINYCEKNIAQQGKVLINIKPNYDGAVIHENRHGNQILQRTHTRSRNQREIEAYKYQKIYNPNSVLKIIEDTRKLQYPHHPNMPYNLEDMVRYLYRN